MSHESRASTEPFVIATGIDGILFTRKPIVAAYSAFRRHSWIQTPQPSDTFRTLKEINAAVKGRTLEDVSTVAAEAVEEITDSTIIPVIELIEQKRSQHPNCTVLAFSSTPDFILHALKATAMPYVDTIVSTTFQVVGGVYTGDYTRLHKEKDVIRACHEAGSALIDLALINGINDMPVALKSLEVVAVNPGPRLSQQIPLHDITPMFA